MTAQFARQLIAYQPEAIRFAVTIAPFAFHSYTGNADINLV